MIFKSIFNSRKKMAIKQSLLLLAIITLAGCMTPRPTTLAGVIIEDFSTDQKPPFNYQPGDTVILTLSVRNIGGADATEAIALLGNLNFGEWSFLNSADNQVKLIGNGILVPTQTFPLSWELKLPSISTSS